MSDRLLRQLLEWRDYEYCEGEQPYELLTNAVEYAHDLMITANAMVITANAMEARAKAAETVLKRVRGLPDDWRERADDMAWRYMRCADELQAELDATPTD